MWRGARAFSTYKDQFEINREKRVSHFFGQTGYETGGFKAKEGESFRYTKKNSNGWNIWFGLTWKETPFKNDCADKTLNPIKKKSKKLKWTALECESSDTDCVEVPTKFIGGHKDGYKGEEMNRKFSSYVYQCEGGNGDKESEDGYKYRGHGAMQLTWKKTYSAFDKWLKENAPEKWEKNIMKNPELLDTDNELYILSAIWYWDIANLNQHADKNDYDKVTKGINRKAAGEKKREKFTEEIYNQMK